MALSGSVTKNGIMIILSMTPTADYIPLSPTRLTMNIEIVNPAGNDYKISNPTMLFDTGNSQYNRSWDLSSPFFTGDIGTWDGAIAPINPGTTRRGSYATTLPASIYDNIERATISVRASIIPVSGGAGTLETFLFGAFTDVYLDSYVAHVPKLLEFTAKRCDVSGNLSDEGQYVRNVIRGSIAPRAGLLPSDHTLRVGYRLQGSSDPYTWVNKTGFAAAIDIDERLDAGDVFAAGSIYEVRCELINNQRSITAHVPSILPKAFANLHLSGSGYGVAMGQYSTATEEHPKFECQYPAHFFSDTFGPDGNPLGMDIYSTDRRVVGEWIDGKPIYRKVLSTGAAMANGATKNISLGEVAISSLIRLEGTKPPDGNGQITMLPTATYNNLAYNTDLALQNFDNNPTIRIRCGSSTGLAANSYIIIEYTLPD